MQGNEYQKLAMRTNDKKAYRRLYIELTGKLPLSPITESNAKCSNINDIAGLLNGVLGLTGEATFFEPNCTGRMTSKLCHDLL